MFHIMNIWPRINISNKKAKIFSSYEGEDRVAYLQTPTFDICMLADGHGGDNVAIYLKNNICNYMYSLYKSLDYLVTNNFKYKSIYDSFEDKIKRHLNNLKNENRPEICAKSLLKLTIDKMSNDLKTNIQGSTLCGFVRLRDHLITFNIGDSRCYALTIDNNLTKLTHDHNFKLLKERKRLNCTNENRKRLDGVLAMTRSIGDSDIPNAIAKPDIRIRKINNFKTLAIVSDGTYESINEHVFKHILLQVSDNNSMNQKIVNNSFSSACVNGNDDRSHLVYCVY